MKIPCSPSASPRTVKVTQRSVCSACGASALERVLELPGFPLTGIYVKAADRGNYACFDQSLLRCATCGHGQLANTIDPAYLYQDTYSHRSSLSPIATRGNDFIHAFIDRVVGTTPLKSIVEIGCNDLYLLKKLQARSPFLLGFDPIWRDCSNGIQDGIHVSGKYIEEIKPADDIAQRPDLIISANTLEHIDNPLASLRPIFDYAAPGATFVVEVPSFDTLVRTARYDQVFHQHLNYFSLGSFLTMIERLGGEYITHCNNFEYWLGTLVIAFRKPAANVTPAKAAAPSKQHVRDQFGLFRTHLDAVSRQIEALRAEHTPICGYGAAQMAPTLAYHLNSDFSFLDGILDENPSRVGLTYPSLRVGIRDAGELPSLHDHGVLVTALDSARPIIGRLIAKRARYILYPISVF